MAMGEQALDRVVMPGVVEHPVSIGPRRPSGKKTSRERNVVAVRPGRALKKRSKRNRLSEKTTIKTNTII